MQSCYASGMQLMAPKTNGRPGRRKITGVIIVLTLLLGLAVSLAMIVIANRPRLLGDSFEYLGKEDYGCWYPLCASKPGSYLFYGTDEDQTALAHRISSSLSTAQPAGEGSAATQYNSFTFSSARGNFKVSYYIQPQAFVRVENLKSTHKKYVISIDSAEYDTILRLLTSAK